MYSKASTFSRSLRNDFVEFIDKICFPNRIIVIDNNHDIRYKVTTCLFIHFYIRHTIFAQLLFTILYFPLAFCTLRAMKISLLFLRVNLWWKGKYVGLYIYMITG